MSFILEKNLASLQLRDAALTRLLKSRPSSSSAYEVGSARNGMPILKHHGTWLHSTYDPHKEAVNLTGSVTSGTLTVLGCGLGYHLQALAEAGKGGTFIEPSLDCFRLALEHIDFTKVLENFRPLAGLSPETIRRAHRDALSGEILVHPPSLRTNSPYFGHLSDFAHALKSARKGGLRILLINPLAGGSLPAACHSAAALRQLGHEVEVFAAETFATGMEWADTFKQPGHRKQFLCGLVSLLTESIELKAREFEPDLVLALAQAPLHHPTLARLRQMGIPTAFWFVEDFRVLPYWRDVAAGYSYFFAIQQGEMNTELQRCGVQRYSYLPTAAAPKVHIPQSLDDADRREFGSPLSFVGAGYYNRRHFFRGLTDYQFKIWGSGWPTTPPLGPRIQNDGERVSTETCIKIFNASTINLNLHSSTSHEGIDATGDFINPRTFEIASCEAFQLVDRRSLLADLFTEDELVTFGDLSDLRDKINHYLTNPEQRLAIARKGRDRVMIEHTYQSRMEELLTLMICAFPQITDKAEGRRLRQHANRESFAELPGMGPLLSQIPFGNSLELESIASVITQGDKPLNRTERIFLMLRDIQTAVKGK